MCGITGGVAQRNVVPILLEGLRRLEYRGYDSAGIAVLHEGHIDRVRQCGKVQELCSKAQAAALVGTVGVAHTRWATHGKPSEDNAHPHMSGESLAVVHNGIIENYEALREALIAKNFVFRSQTDTEVIAHCLHEAYAQTADLLQAVVQAVQRLEGAYALAVISAEEPNRLVVARRGSPLVIGLGLSENFIASDPLALLPVTQTFILLEEGDIAVIEREHIWIQDKTGYPVQRASRQIQVSLQATEKGTYRHFMHKEIFEQPAAIHEALAGRLLDKSIPDHIFGAKAADIFDQTTAVQIIACGTSYHAGLVAKYWLESVAGISTQVEIASEFRYRDPVLRPNTLLVLISQSGETADTLAALQGADKSQLSGTLGICNVPESALVRACDCVLLTHAGPEIGVASTKAFTTQLVALLLLTAVLGRRRGLGARILEELIQALRSLPERMERVLNLEEGLKSAVPYFRGVSSALFLGRRKQVAIAMEGALKLKEISYIHAEAYPAGELKHGPLALIDEHMPIVVLIPKDALLPKMKSNVEEIKARGGQIIAIVEEGVHLAADKVDCLIVLPTMPSLLVPILMTLPLQLLAYHVAVDKGTDVDQPRHLAKSVTVE